VELRDVVEVEHEVAQIVARARQQCNDARDGRCNRRRRRLFSLRSAPGDMPAQGFLASRWQRAARDAARADWSPASTIASPSTPPPVPSDWRISRAKVSSATPVSATPRTSVAVLPPRPLRSRAITSFAANGLSPALAAAGSSPVPSGSVPRNEARAAKGFGAAGAAGSGWSGRCFPIECSSV
jgi:hypothetical protein